MDGYMRSPQGDTKQTSFTHLNCAAQCRLHRSQPCHLLSGTMHTCLKLVKQVVQTVQMTTERRALHLESEFIDKR